MDEQSEKSGRRFEVVVWGASGFTGRLVAQYLYQRYPDNLRWAVAGRNRAKLDAVLDGFCEAGRRPEILIGDSTDTASLRRIAQDTRVVLTTVGPYALYGDDLVEACISSGTDYCDLCG